MLSIQNEREWQRLCEVGIARTDLLADARCVDNPTRVDHRDFVDSAVLEAVAELSYTEVQARFARADLAFAPVNAIGKLKTHPDFHTVEVAVGETTVELPREYLVRLGRQKTLLACQSSARTRMKCSRE